MKRVTLYVVDDERLSIQYFKRLIRENEDQWELVGESTNGREAYEEILRLHPDIIFADISMPVMDELQLAEKLMARDGIRPGEASAAVGFASAQYFSSIF